MRVESAWGQPYGRLRIRTRLALLVLALAIPFLMFSVISAVQETHIESDQAAAQMLGTARITAARLDDHINDIHQVLGVLSGVVSVDPAKVKDNDALLRRLVGKLPPHVNNVTVWTASGENVGAIDPRVRSQGGSQIAQRKFFRDAMAGSSLAVEAPVVSISNGALIGIFAAPIVRQGRTVGVVATSVRLAPLQGLLASEALPTGSVITVTDIGGVVLARSIDPEHWIGRNLRKAPSGGVEDAWAKREGVRIGPSADGVERVGGFTTARAAPWLVYVGVPKEIALAAAHEHLRSNLLMAGATLLVGLFLAFFISESIASPLRKLSREAISLGLGNPHHRIETRANGEVGMLAATLDRMAQQLQDRGLALQASQEQLRQVTDNLPVLISYIDRERKFRFANRVYERWLGVDPADLIGKSLLELYGPQAYEGFRSHIERALAGQRVTYERDLLTLHGNRRVEVTAVPDRSADGEIMGIYVLMADITQAKLAQSAVAESEHRLEMIANNIPALVSYVDRDERFRFVNSAVEQTTGKASSELLGRTIREVRGETLYGELQSRIKSVLCGVKVEFQGVWKRDGQAYDYQSSYVPDVDAQGEVRGYFEMMFDITTFKETQRRLDLLARRDVLTGLPNRRDFSERLQAAMARARRSKAPVALVFLDVDHFKQINDNLGHAVGDQVLKGIAARLREAVRSTDTVARWAGDEFVIVLEGIKNTAEVTSVVEKLGDCIRQPMKCSSGDLVVTSSIGFAIYDGGDTSVEALTAKADDALYRAKAAGRDTFAANQFDEFA